MSLEYSLNASKISYKFRFSKHLDLLTGKKIDPRGMMKEASKPTVYLAGDPKSGWQSKVCRAIQDLQLLDPSKYDLADPNELARWGLQAIRESDVVLAYLEKEDQNGHALAFELGYAKALGKTILLVQEHGTGEEDKYFQRVREVADFCFDSLGEAVSYLVLSFLFEQNAKEKIGDRNTG
jgi:hypothetical protein